MSLLPAPPLSFRPALILSLTPMDIGNGARGFKNTFGWRIRGRGSECKEATASAFKFSSKKLWCGLPSASWRTVAPGYPLQVRPRAHPSRFGLSTPIPGRMLLHILRTSVCISLRHLRLKILITDTLMVYFPCLRGHYFRVHFKMSR
jgi:hypothetical protein